MSGQHLAKAEIDHAALQEGFGQVLAFGIVGAHPQLLEHRTALGFIGQDAGTVIRPFTFSKASWKMPVAGSVPKEVPKVKLPVEYIMGLPL